MRLLLGIWRKIVERGCPVVEEQRSETEEGRTTLSGRAAANSGLEAY